MAERLASQTKFWSKKSKVQKILGQKSMVKISSVTTKTFLIWTNVASTNVTWTNVTMSIGIWWVGGGDVQSHFRVKPNLGFVRLS